MKLLSGSPFSVDINYALIFLDQKKHQRNTKNMSTRRATHAGSWYLDDGKALSKELEEWLKAASAQVFYGTTLAEGVQLFLDI